MWTVEYSRAVVDLVHDMDSIVAIEEDVNPEDLQVTGCTLLSTVVYDICVLRFSALTSEG